MSASGGQPADGGQPAAGGPAHRRPGDTGADSRDDDNGVFAAPVRRTYLAQERTLLAWWRTALATVGLAVAVGSILPKLTRVPRGPYVALGVGYAALSVCFVLIGAYRERANERAFAERRFLGLEKSIVMAMTVYLTALVGATVWVMLWRR